MLNLREDLRDGLRTFQKSPGFAAIGILTLALGMAVNTAIFSVVNGMILRPLPVPHPEQVTVLALRQGSNPAYFFSYPDYQYLRSQTNAFSDLFKLVLGQGLGVVAIGLAVGLLAALAATRAMTGMLMGVSPSDPLMYAVVTVFLSSVALLACLIPALRATRVDSLIALRYE